MQTKIILPPSPLQMSAAKNSDQVNSLNERHNSGEARSTHLSESENALHHQTLKLVQEERRLTGLIVENLQSISDQKLFLRMGYSSLFEYCTRALGYSESCAYRRISVVRVAKELPEVREKLNSGALNLTHITMAQTLFSKGRVSQKEKKEILQKIENSTKREAEEILANEAEKCGVQVMFHPHRDSVRHVANDEASLHIRVKRETVRELDRVKQLRSHKNPRMSYGDVIEDMCEIVLTKIDPVRTKNETSTLTHRSTPEKSSSKNLRYIPANLRRAVWQRDEAQCTFLNRETNMRCNSRHLLQIDHIQPISCGGGTNLENLRLLCHAHHRYRVTE